MQSFVTNPPFPSQEKHPLIYTNSLHLLHACSSSADALCLWAGEACINNGDVMRVLIFTRTKRQGSLPEG